MQNVSDFLLSPFENITILLKPCPWPCLKLGTHNFDLKDLILQILHVTAQTTRLVEFQLPDQLLFLYSGSSAFASEARFPNIKRDYNHKFRILLKIRGHRI